MTVAALVLAASTASSPPNLLLVTIDTLRADRLHAYGYAAIDTPVTDRLAKEGVVVEDATVQAPQTRPSHVSILTGRYPYEHGVRDNFSPPLKADVPTLATILQAKNYDTAAFLGGYPLEASSGLNRGFAVYDDHFRGAGQSGAQTMAERRGDLVVDSALRWLRKPRVRPFFAWVHLYDPHSPYEPPAPFDKRYAGRPYDGEVAYADAQVGRLIEFLDAKGLRGRTLVVVTSDHGEGLGDHGEDEHLLFIYDSTLRVPLLWSWPGVVAAGARIPGQFRSVDIVPTVLDLLGAPRVATTGVSRATVLKPGARLPDNESYAESLYGSLHFGYAPLRALRAEGWKYVEAPRAELYNLKDDPGESKNLLELRGEVAGRMRDRLAAFDKGGGIDAALAVPADAGVIERLVALGYVGGGPARSGTGGSAAGADPKDKIQDLQSYSRDLKKGMDLFRKGDVDGALPILTRLSRRDSVSFEVQLFLGKSLLRKRRWADAAKALEEAQALLPRFAGTYVDLSQAFRMQGRLKEARAVVDRGLGVAPGNAALWEEGGLVLQQMGDLPTARAAFEKARTLDPKAARARLALSAIYRDQGDLKAAIAEVREAVRLEPRFGDGWNALGVLLSAAGQKAEATKAFRSALEIRPDDPDVLFNLAELLAQHGGTAEALSLLERVSKLAPEYPGLAEALAEARGVAGPVSPGCMGLRLLKVRERAEAEAIAVRLAAGAAFAEVARAASIDPSAAKGGDLGTVCLSDLAEPLRTAAAALSPGASSPVVETPTGYVLLKRER
jgi:tetratricopeptide (TPR) repeat protein